MGRNLNAIARLMHRGGSQTGPIGGELQMLLRVCEALRDHVRALIKVNLVSWQVGHDSRNS